MYNKMDKTLACLVFIVNVWIIECTICERSSCNKNVTCPNNKPYTICDASLNNTCKYICVNTCQKNQVLDGTKCINVTECKKDIVFQDKCLSLCPVGYVFNKIDNYDRYQHTTADLNRQICVSIASLRLNVACYAMATVAYILFLIAFFSMKSFSLSSMKKFFRSIFKCKKKENEDSDDDSDEEMIRQARNHATDDDDDMNILL